MVSHSTLSSAKWGVCLLRGSFDIKKRVGVAVRINQLHRNGLNKHPRESLACFMLKFLFTNKGGEL